MVDFVEWFDDILPVLCGSYRLTPAEVADQTPAELYIMLEGIDWVSDREWERVAFMRATHEGAQNLLDLSYPHFRTPRVLRIIRSDEAPPDDEAADG